jgi:hypothetical protein
MGRKISGLLLKPLRSNFTCDDNPPDENLITYETTSRQKQSDKMGSDINFAKYIENITKYLGDKYCFVSGAFVVADPNGKLYNLLRPGAGSSAHLNLPGITASHRALSKINPNPLAQNKTFAQSNLSLTTAGDIHIDKKMYENKFKNSITIKCKCPLSPVDFSERTFEIVKWYQFVGIDNKIYIYFKLEDHPTLCWAHTREAIKTYTLKKGNKSCVMARREDCKKDCSKPKSKSSSKLTAVRDTAVQDTEQDQNCCKPLDEPKRIIINDNVTNIDSAPYGRVGNEMYIPSIVSDLFITNSNGIKITHSEPDTVTIEYATISGGIKMKKRRKVTRKGKRKGRKSAKKTRRR